MTTTRILVVEDEGVLALQISRDLEMLGYAVVGIFASGAETLKSIVAAGPDLVLMDIHLAGEIDGVETAEKIADVLDIPVVFLIAHSEDEIIDRVKNITPDGYLLKPIGPHELHIGIQVALARHEKNRQLKETQRWLATVLKSTGEAIITTDNACRVTLMNLRAEQYTGWTTAEAMGKRLHEVLRLQADGVMALPIEEQLQAAVLGEGRTINFFEGCSVIGRDSTQMPVDGSAAPIHGEKGIIVGTVLTFRDVTERQRLRLYRCLAGKVFEILSTTSDFKDAIENILSAIQHATGCDAVGIRLQHGEDFPYLAQRGFSGDFLRSENSLVDRDKEGAICRGPDGKVKLECTCGMVIAGKTDPAHPLCTPGGSFWTNDSLPLLKLPVDAEPRLHHRNHCIHHGFMSVTLVPIREKQQIVGLLQLNHRKKDAFSLEVVEILETMANSIGEALLRRQAEEALKQHKIRLQEAHDMLEVRVAEKTRDLSAANELLMLEIKERLRAEESLEIQSDIHAILSTSSIVLLFGRDRESVIHSVCEVAVESGHFNLAWAGFLDSEGQVNIMSAAGPATRYLKGITITNDGTLVSGQGPTGTCIRTNRTIINDDFAIDPACTHWREQALAHGLRSSVKIPIREGKRCIGALSLYAPLPGFFTEERVALLEQLVSNLSSALDLLHAEARAKAASEALRVSEEKYRIVADNNYDWEFWVGPQGEYIYVSPACERITGHSAGEFQSNPELILQILHPEDLPRYLALPNTINRDLPTEVLVFRVLRPDGQVRWIEHLFQPVFAEDGKYLGNRGSNRDITKRKLAEAQILQSKKRLQAVFDGISEPLIMVAKDMTLKMVNMAAVRYYNLLSPADAIGRTSCEALNRKGDRCPTCPIPVAVAGNEEVTFFREGYMDPEKFESVTIFPIFSEKPEDSGAVIRVTDITKARMMEKALIRSEKLASIGVLTAGVAHEINNPNNFIMFNVPVLRRYYLEAILPIIKEHAASHSDSTSLFFGMSFEEFEKDLGELADAIENGSERIKTIVSELKGFSSPDDKEKIGWFDSQVAINQAIRYARVQLKDTVKRLDVDLQPGLPHAFFEQGRLEQAIVNLLINAAQAADKKDSWVMLRAKVEDEDFKHLVIEVEDNGSGIEEKNLVKLFDPFFTTKAPGFGTGLGLYVCQNLIDKAGGSIDVQSRLGEGTTFTIRLLCK